MTMSVPFWKAEGEGDVQEAARRGEETSMQAMKILQRQQRRLERTDDGDLQLLPDSSTAEESPPSR